MYMPTILQRFRRTDRRTDGRTTYGSNTFFAPQASRGKNLANLHMHSVPAVIAYVYAWIARVIMHTVGKKTLTREFVNIMVPVNNCVDNIQNV